MNEPTAAQAHEHPAWQRLMLIYRNARKDWALMPSVRAAAETLGMDERAYADARLNANQFSWVATTTTGALTQEHLDAAYEESAYVG